MRHPRPRLVLLLAFAALLTTAAAEAPPVRWKPQADMDNQLFPSLIIATATRRPGADADTPTNPDLLGDHFGLLGISIRSPGPKTRVKVTVHENGVLNTSAWSGTLPEGNHTYLIAPPISYKYDALRRVRGQTPLSVQIDLEVNGQPVGTQSETVTLRSINDCPWAVAGDEETLGDDENKDKSAEPKPKAPDGLHGDSDTALGWMFAAYVNEDHPVIDVLLKEALHTGIITNVDGYQDEKPEEVLRQAFAVWKVLQDRGVRYSDISTNPGGSDKVYSQYVRFVEESLRHEQANCVDGSVLFASILRKMGLAPFLVVVPGHMYMGVALSASEDDDSTACIETTMLGAGEPDASLKAIPEIRALEKTLDTEVRASPAWRTFKTAVAVATAAFRGDKSKFEDKDNSDYQIIDVAAARADGILPIPFDRPERTPQLPGGPPREGPLAGAGTPDKPLPTPFVKPPTRPVAYPGDTGGGGDDADADSDAHAGEGAAQSVARAGGGTRDWVGAERIVETGRW